MTALWPDVANPSLRGRPLDHPGPLLCQETAGFFFLPRTISCQVRRPYSWKLHSYGKQMCTRAMLKVAWICQKRREKRLSLEDHASEGNLPWGYSSGNAKLNPEWLLSWLWHYAFVKCEFAEVTEIKRTLCIQGILSSFLRCIRRVLWTCHNTFLRGI